MKATLFTLILLVSFSIFAQNKPIKDISFDEFTTETQVSSDNPDAIEMIWWLPKTFWEVSMTQDPSLSEADVAATVEIIDGFEIFAIVRGSIGYMGGITYEPAETVTKSFSASYNSKKLSEVKLEDENADLKVFITLMQPMMENMMGELGANMHFVVLKNSAESIDLYKEGVLNVNLAGFESGIDLPLASLLLEKKCLIDAKEWSGKFIYCPIHGNRLK